MAFEFKFPDLGEGLTEGEVVQWKVQVGDKVADHQVLLEVETDKAVVEIPSPKAGYVLRLKGGPGDIIKVGEVIAVIGSEKELDAARASDPLVSTKPALRLPPPAMPVAPPPEPYTVQAPSVGVVGSLEEAPEDAPPTPEPKVPLPVIRPRVAES